MTNEFPDHSYDQTRMTIHRSDVIANTLQNVQPSITSVLDIGANTGEIVYHISKRLPITGTLVDKPGSRLHRQVPISGFEYLEEEIKCREDVTALGRHDVVMALSVLHHITSWKSVLEGIYDIANRVIILEVPHPNERMPSWCPTRSSLHSLSSAVEGLGGVTIGQAPSFNGEFMRNIKMIEVGQ